MFLTLALCLPIFSNVAYASESKEVKNEVVLHKETYLSELTNESDFLNNKMGIRISWWKRAYKSPFSKFLISVEKSTPKLSVMS